VFFDELRLALIILTLSSAAFGYLQARPNRRSNRISKVVFSFRKALVPLDVKLHDFKFCIAV